MHLQVGDIVQRVDINGRKRFVIVSIAPPWIYTRSLGDGGTPGVITFPSQYMLKKVA
jgi:hypothetical protein